MWDDPNQLKKHLVHLEELKVGIMRQINVLNANKKAIYPTKVYPVADVNPLQINSFPVLQIKYEGVLPLYSENKPIYEQIISDYYYHATTTAYNYKDLVDYFEEVLIVFCHYFKDDILRDLDNRNGKYIIDALRHTRIISDDNWQVVSKLDTAFKGTDNCLYVYVVDKLNASEFLKELFNNHDDYTTANIPVIDKEEFIRLRRKEIETERKLEEKMIQMNKEKRLKKPQSKMDELWS